MQGRAWKVSVGTSVFTLWFLLLLHLILFGFVWLVPISRWWQGAISLILLASAFFYYRRYASRSKVTAIEHSDTGQWRLHYSDQTSSWLVLQSAYCAFFGVILYFEQKRFSTLAVFVAYDSVAADDLRMMRICVRDARSYQQQ